MVIIIRFSTHDEVMKQNHARIKNILSLWKRHPLPWRGKAALLTISKTTMEDGIWCGEAHHHTWKFDLNGIPHLSVRPSRASPRDDTSFSILSEIEANFPDANINITLYQFADAFHACNFSALTNSCIKPLS